jgi:hypothetical protein
VYWRLDKHRRSDRTGKRAGKSRLNYNWPAIDRQIKESLDKGKPSLRKLFYILVSKEVLPNIKKTYGALGDHMTKLRNEGILSPDCLSDERHPIVNIDDIYYSPKAWIKYYIEKLWNFPQDYLKNDQGFPKWHEQKHYVELWTEKSAMIDELEQVVNEANLQVRIVAFGGWAGFTLLNNHVNRLKSKMHEGKSVHILYFGDLDPSGFGMDTSFLDRLGIGIEGIVKPWNLSVYGELLHVGVSFERVGVTPQQVENYNLPWDPEKMSDEVQDKIANDPRTKEMRERFGGVLATEVDALPALYANEFREIVTNAVNKYFDDDIHQRELERHRRVYTEKYIDEELNDSVQMFIGALNIKSMWRWLES